jgi:hypothetical protein
MRTATATHHQPRKARLVPCPHCREGLYTAAEIQRGRDSEGDDIETTAQQWQCGACGSWNDRARIEA